MPKYNICQNCDLTIKDFFDGASGFEKPLFNLNEADDIVTVTGASITINKECDQTTDDQTTITPCPMPASSVTISSCTFTAGTPNYNVVNVTFTQSSYSTITNSNWYFRIYEGVTLVSETVLTGSGGSSVIVPVTTVDRVYKFVNTFTACGLDFTFEQSFLVEAGDPPTCFATGDYSMSAVVSSPNSTATYGQVNNDLVLGLDSYGDNEIISVDIELTYTDINSVTQTVIIPICFYKDCDDEFKCKVVKYAVENSDYNVMAMYESLTYLTECRESGCENITCADACPVLEYLKETVNDCAC